VKGTGSDFFREATIRLCSSLEIGKAMSSCFAYLKDYLPASEMFLTMFDPELGLLHNLAAVGNKGIRKPLPSKHIPPEAIARINFDVNAWQEVKILDRLEMHPAGLIFFHHLKPSRTSAMYINLVIEGKYLGSVVFLANGKGLFKQAHAVHVDRLREPFTIAVANALRYREVLRLKEIVDAENQDLVQELRYMTENEIVGEEGGLAEVMEMVRQVASIRSPVLLLGETGVGKEVVANAIHYTSPRRGKPLVKVNCGAIPESLMDSELFGHERGAFTGAVAQKKGRFERANQGSIFLDEVAELPPSIQVRLLRVLQTKEIERVGGTEPIRLDIRVIAATHRNLEDMVQAGRFREDLWYRLNIFPLMIPPLRHRRGDIPALIHHFIEKKARELKIHTPPPLSPTILERLKAYPWPGNVRELENLVEREMIKCRGPNRRRFFLFDHFRPSSNDVYTQKSFEGRGPMPTLDEATFFHIQQALAKTAGKIYGRGGAAELLGINPNTLRSRMKKLGISFSKQQRQWESVNVISG